MLASVSSLFPSRCRLHTIDDGVFADAALGADRVGLVSVPFGYDYDLIFIALRNAQGKLTPRISIGLPPKLFFTGSTHAKVCAGQRIGFVGEDCAENKKIVGVGVTVLAA